MAIRGERSFDVSAGEWIFDHGNRRRAPGRRRDVRPISRYVSSTTVTILRMIALIVVRLVV